MRKTEKRKEVGKLYKIVERFHSIKGNKSFPMEVRQLIRVLKKHKEWNAVKMLKENYAKLTNMMFKDTIALSEAEHIRILCPPLSQRWTVIIRDFERGTCKYYTSSGLQDDMTNESFEDAFEKCEKKSWE